MHVVITGGPGSGKTALIAELRRSGFACVDEAGRAIIQDQLAIGGRALHRADSLLFAEVMLAWEIRSYRQATRWEGRWWPSRRPTSRPAWGSSWT